MTATVKRMTLGFGAGLIALTAVAGVFVQAQDQDPQAQTRGHRGGGPGGPDGPGRFGGPGGPMGILPMLGRDLDLTDAQRDQVKAIAESHKADWRALADRARTAHRALNEAVTTAPIDEALIRQKSSEVAAVDADMAVARARAHAEVFQILTPEQKEKVKARKLEGRGRGKN
jgi:Spy/CpxP family protein refolding chaperone